MLLSLTHSPDDVLHPLLTRSLAAGTVQVTLQVSHRTRTKSVVARCTLPYTILSIESLETLANAQGMTTAALQAKALQQQLQVRPNRISGRA